MDLFSYLNYDGSLSSSILESIKIITGKQVSKDELNRILESGDGVYYMTPTLRVVNNPEEAQYMILDTHLPILLDYRVDHEASLGDTACISINKSGLNWQGGYVSTYKKLIGYICSRSGNTQKLKKACSTNIGSYVVAAKKYMSDNPDIMEQFIKEEEALLKERNKTRELKAESSNGTDKELNISYENKEDNCCEEKNTLNSISTVKVVGAARAKKEVASRKSKDADDVDTALGSGSGKEDKPIYIPSEVSDYISKYMLDKNEYWTPEKIRIVLWRTILVALKHLDNKEEGAYVLSDDNIVINSGFIGDDYEYMLLACKVSFINGESSVQSVGMIKGKDDLITRGFTLDLVVPTLLDCVKEKVDRVDFSDRSRMIHCVEERGFRIGIEEKDLNNSIIRSTIERIKASVELSLSLERKGIKMFVPFYYFSGDGKMQFMIPMYNKMVPNLSKPDGALIIGEKNGVWEVDTTADMKMAIDNVLVIDKYLNTPWISVSKANTY